MLERHQWRLLPRLEPLLQRRQRLAHVLRHVLVVTHDHHNAVGLLVYVERGERFEADASVRAALWDKQKRPELLRKETQDTRRRGAVLQQGGGGRHFHPTPWASAFCRMASSRAALSAPGFSR